MRWSSFVIARPAPPIPRRERRQGRLEGRLLWLRASRWKLAHRRMGVDGTYQAGRRMSRTLEIEAPLYNTFIN